MLPIATWNADNPSPLTLHVALLDDLETTFAQKTTAFLSNSRTDLDVEIGVLRDRLKLET